MTGRRLNVAFPDLQAVYQVSKKDLGRPILTTPRTQPQPLTPHPPNLTPQQVLVMQNVDERSIFRIKGKFPTKGVRYFSLQSNNVALGQAVTTIVDYEIAPDAGRWVGGGLVVVCVERGGGFGTWALAQARVLCVTPL